MPEINILKKETFSQIAAGEVVEKPASVVKELIENSIDANSKNITIEIIEGGLKLIKIIDDGKGILNDDIRSAFLPHATSKIKEIKDIFQIMTLGFRGEALASVSSVSKISLKTKHINEEDGMEIYIEGGEEKYLKYSPITKGTQIEVKELFYNVPARLKFLKTPQKEGANISDVILRLALSHPEISFTYFNNEKCILRTYGTNNQLDVIRAVYNRKTAENVSFFKNEYEDYTISGYIGNETLARGSRNQQSLFINKRYVNSKSLTIAVEQAFKSFITISKFPFFVLNIDLAPLYVDVNVHPQKAEVKFSDDRLMFKSVFDTIHLALRENYKNDLGFNSSFEEDINPIQEKFFNSATNNINNINEKTNVNGNICTANLKHHTDTNSNIPTYTNQGINNSYLNHNIEEQTPKLNNHYSHNNNDYFNNENNSEINNENNSEKNWDKYKINGGGNDRSFEDLRVSDSPNANDLNTTLKNNNDLISQNSSKYDVDLPITLNLEEKNIEKIAKFPMPRIIGQFNKTYILAELNLTLYLFDQHAAHEKINFEKYLDEIHKGQMILQPLLVPEVLELSMDDYNIYSDNKEIFENTGFIIDEFGDRAVNVREVPYFLGKIEVEKYFKEIIDNLKNLGKGTTKEVKYLKIATTACKASIKANDELSFKEMEALINELRFINEPFTCPHGRPTMIKITKNDLEKEFKRIQ